jgi:hypothetical protein
MTSENLKQLTEQKLREEEKNTKRMVILFRFIIGSLIVALIYSIFKKDFSSSGAIPLLLLGSYLMQIEKKYKAVQMEIQSRKAQ